MDLQEFDFDVRHRPGNSNQNADALSRLNHKKTLEVAASISLTLATNLVEAQRNDPDSVTGDVAALPMLLLAVGQSDNHPPAAIRAAS